MKYTMPVFPRAFPLQYKHSKVKLESVLGPQYLKWPILKYCIGAVNRFQRKEIQKHTYKKGDLN